MAASLGAGKSGLQPAAGPKGQNHFASPNAALKKPLFHVASPCRGISPSGVKPRFMLRSFTARLEAAPFEDSNQKDPTYKCSDS